MFLTYLKTALRDAMSRAFADDTASPQFQGLYVSIEYPNKPEAYPGIWVDYEPQTLTIIGVGHTEFVASTVAPFKTAITRWAFAGNATFTLVAMSSLERDRLYDEVIALVAFNKESAPRRTFRQVMENNEFIGVNLNWDAVVTGGMAAQQGTPWGTDEMLYEVTISMNLIGDFALAPGDRTGALVALSQIIATPIPAGTPDPTTAEGWV